MAPARTIHGQPDLVQRHPGRAPLPAWQCYLFAVAVTVATLVVRKMLDDAPGASTASIIFAIPVMLSAYFGGLRAGLLSTALSFLGASYFVSPPLHSWAMASGAERWEQVLFAGAGIVISGFNEAFHRALRAARMTTRRVEEAQAALLSSRNEQLQLMQQMMTKHARLIAAQAVAKVGSWETETATMATTWSAETHRIFGTDPGSFVPSHEDFLGRVHPDDRMAVRDAFAASSAQPGEHRIEHRILTVDSRVKTVEERWQWIAGADGRVSKAIGTCQDVTERNDAEAVHARSAAILDSVGQAVIATDAQGAITYANLVASELYGWRVEDVLGKNIMKLTAPLASREQVAQIMAQLQRGEKWIGELEVRRSDGTTFPALVTNVAQRDAQGTITGIIGISKDITERRQAEATLIQGVQQTARRERLLSTTLSSMTDFAYAYDRDGRFMFVNQPLLDFWGLTLEQALGRNFAELGYPPDLAARLEREVAQVFDTRQVVTGEALYASPVSNVQGSYEYIFSPALAEDGSVDFVVGTTRDITERKQSEAKLDKTHRQLLEASRNAGMAEVATNVLHNVGNVLNSVNVSASLAVESVKGSRVERMAQVVALMADHKADLGSYITSDPAGRHIPAFLADVSREWSSQQKALVSELDSLRENVDHIKQIVAMQQSYARIAGTTEITKVDALIEDALRVQRGSMEEHRVRIVREFADVPPITVAKHKVLPILVNLMRNAKHACFAMPDTDRCVILRIERVVDRVRLSVIDDGMGIAPENMTRIFSHGFTTRKDGHGFGLHSGALAASELGGSLTVHSDGVGKGATFTLELPMHPAEPPE